MPTPEQIVRDSRPGHTVVGWRLAREQRGNLLNIISPTYPEIVADHVTLIAKVARATPLPDRVEAQVIGRADDGEGVEALVVAIDGQTDRPGGSTYHITWSLAPGRRAVESNDVIAALGWKGFDEPLPVTLEPARFP